LIHDSPTLMARTRYSTLLLLFNIRGLKDASISHFGIRGDYAEKSNRIRYSLIRSS
jgi:hypothetical protein